MGLRVDLGVGGNRWRGIALERLGLGGLRLKVTDWTELYWTG